MSSLVTVYVRPDSEVPKPSTIDVPTSITQCPGTLIRVAGYGTGRKLTPEVALTVPRLTVMWVVTLVRSAPVRPCGGGSLPVAVAVGPRPGPIVQAVVDRLPRMYICRYCGSGSVVR